MLLLRFAFFNNMLLLRFAFFNNMLLLRFAFFNNMLLLRFGLLISVSFIQCDLFVRRVKDDPLNVVVIIIVNFVIRI